MKHIKNFEKAKSYVKKYYDELERKCKKTGSKFIDIEKSRKEWESRLAAADKAPSIEQLVIHVKWADKKCAVRAKVRIDLDSKEFLTVYSEGYDCGWGQDIPSMAVAEAFEFKCKKDADDYHKRACPVARAALDRFVIEHGMRLWDEAAIEKRPFPHFCFGGKGLIYLRSLFKPIGYWCRNPVVKDYYIDFSGETGNVDYYHIIRKDCI